MYPSDWIRSLVMNWLHPQSIALGHSLNILSGLRLLYPTTPPAPVWPVVGCSSVSTYDTLLFHPNGRLSASATCRNRLKWWFDARPLPLT